MNLNEILSLPKGVEKIDSVDAIIGFVNKVEHKQGTAKTGKNIGKPYSFFCQNIQLTDGENQMYWNATFKTEADTIQTTDKGKRIRIMECVIDYYMSKKDNQEHKVLKGGFADNIGEVSRADIPEAVKENALKAKEAEIKASIEAMKPSKSETTKSVVNNTPIVVKPTDWEAKERRGIRSMCLAYSKDLVIAGKVEKIDMEGYAEELCDWVYENVPEPERADVEDAKREDAEVVEADDISIPF